MSLAHNPPPVAHKHSKHRLWGSRCGCRFTCGNRRRHYPKRITYRYYDLDGKDSYAAGVYYLGFQNLQPEKGSSLFFDVQHDGNRFVVETKAGQGKVGGSFCLYISEVDFSRPIEVTYNGKTVFHDKIIPNVGTMVESTALFGDPSRVYPAKVTLKMQ